MTDWALRPRKGPLAPNASLWEALGRGTLLRTILERFYERVYADPRLAPFFDGVSRERAVDKQFSFLAEIFTGERMFFGDRPRNAHHWMVISDELFDYRERLFAECLAAHGLSAEHVAAWLGVHETFRKQIVKSAPFPRRMDGVEMPLDGWESMTLSAGTLCDGCHHEIPAGASVKYRLRKGTTLCATCGEGK